jgi:hypothetical protein
MKIIFFTFLLISSITFNTSAQTPEYGENLTYSPTPVECNPDSIIVVATNRIFDSTSAHFLTQEIDSYKPLKYFVATSLSGKWVVFEETDAKNALKYFPEEKNFVFFVHGDGKTFPLTLQRSQALANNYKVHVVAFDYPSLKEGYSGLRNFYNSRKNVKKSTAHFWKFMEDLKLVFTDPASRFYQANRTLFAHSLGNYLLMKTMQNKNLENRQNIAWVDNTLLNAGAVKQTRHRKWVNKMDYQKRIYITSNKNDYTLKGAMLITFSKQMGGNIKKTNSSEAVYINFTNTSGPYNNCWLEKNLLESPSHFYFFYNEVLNGEEFPVQNSTYVEKREEGGFYLK